MRTDIQVVGPIDESDTECLSDFLGHSCLLEGDWVKMTRTDSTFEFAICSNGNYFIRLPGYSANHRKYPIKQVKYYFQNDGYLMVSGFTAMHSMIAQAFMSDYTPYPEKEVNHKDGNKLNNDVSNLEMVTHRQNIDHFFQSEVMAEKREVWRNRHRGTNHWTEGSLASFRSKMKGRTCSEETRAKISAIHKGKKLSPEHITRLREANKGNTWTRNRIRVTDGFNNRTIKIEELPNWEAKGFWRGYTIRNRPRQKKKYEHTPEFLAKQALRNASKEVTSR